MVAHGHPTVGSSVQRRITKDVHVQYASILGIARLGTAKDLEGLLQIRPSSVYDVDARHGKGPLAYIVQHAYTLNDTVIDNVKLHIKLGADTLVLDDDGRTAAMVEMIARAMIGLNELSVKDASISTDCYEVYDLSHITEIMLGLRPLNLSKKLLKTEVYRDINLKDGTGLTPLHWAVRIGNLSAVKQLLDAGADLHTMDTWGYTPLSKACMDVVSASCVELLARAGADFGSRDSMNIYPFITQQAPV